MARDLLTNRTCGVDLNSFANGSKSDRMGVSSSAGGLFSGKLQAPLQIYGGLEIVIDMRTGTKGQLLQTWLLVRGLGLLKTLTHFAENLNYISEVKPMNNRVY